ncbi:MAG TPA: 16S rRNA (cytosine(1402)-N(4))-methyltransferase RsmH [Gammaproteobacteria bacterium]
MAHEELTHRPVLLNEVLEALNIQSGGIYLDGTFGRGGHARAVLARLGAQGQLLATDKDPAAIETGRKLMAEDGRFGIVQGSYTMLGLEAKRHGWEGRVNGILLDLGVSSPQLDDASRGFSFRSDGPLDMRMDTTSGESAAAWLAHASEREIADVLFEYGEERHARRIARAIVRSREADGPIQTTGRLAEVVAAANPSWERDKHPATRSFQAIRIHINGELNELEQFLPQCIDLLAPGGRLAIISFHSLEDRRVKRFIRDQARGDDFPPGLPITSDQIHARLRAVGKAIYASDDELRDNPRARSAVLRVAERCA